MTARRADFAFTERILEYLKFLCPTSLPALRLSRYTTHSSYPCTYQSSNSHSELTFRQNANDTVDEDDQAEPFGVLAKEFGVEAQLVHAFAQRLAAF